MAQPNSGDLDKRITIETLTQTQDVEGGMVDSWATYLQAWAKVNNLSGSSKRLTDVGGAVAAASTEFTIRYRPGVQDKQRIVYGGKIYNIQHVNNYLEQNAFLILTCDTGQNDGR